MEEKRYIVTDGGATDSPMSEGAAVRDSSNPFSLICSCDCWVDAEWIADLLNKDPITYPES